MCIFLVIKIHLMHKSTREIIEKLDMIIDGDTNNIITVPSGDKQIQQLAFELNKRLRRIRKLQLRCQSGENELKGAITNISHDIRTPLTAILGYLEIMKDIPKSEKLSQYLEIIQGRANAMKTLTEELFRYSACVSGEGGEPQPTNNKAIIKVQINVFIRSPSPIAFSLGLILSTHRHPSPKTRYLPHLRVLCFRLLHHRDPHRHQCS